MLEDKLLKVGFTKNEAKVYLLLLDLGKSKLYDLARSLEMNHVTTLNCLKSLEKKKVIYKESEGKQKYYYIHNPKHGLRKFLQNLQDDLDKKRSIVDETMDGFDIRYAALDNKPGVKFIEGNDAESMIRSEVSNTKYDMIYEFTNLDEAYRVIPRKKGDHRSVNRKIDHNAITIYTSAEGDILKNLNTKLKKKYFIPKDIYDFPGEISTFGDKVVLISFSPKHIGVVIKNENIAKTMQNLFKLATETAKNSK